eukprot:TRINITY_DN2782_c0_g2_i1.p1 TRINITY_DN2782_c0_g2~~TRINITY_DN2782_c0_g2_i1.p1  ORF type:complete len:589 (-),score=84.35 TRINITY_DN2782_c0_g2_i1:64-1830(-)
MPANWLWCLVGSAAVRLTPALVGANGIAGEFLIKPARCHGVNCLPQKRKTSVAADASQGSAAMLLELSATVKEEPRSGGSVHKSARKEGKAHATLSTDGSGEGGTAAAPGDRFAIVNESAPPAVEEILSRNVIRQVRQKLNDDGVWFFLSQVPDQERVWPFWAKVGVVICIFICFEYLLDLLSWCGADGVSPIPGLSSSGGVVRREKCMNYRDPNEGMNGDTVGADGVLRNISVLTLNVWVNRARENVERQIHGIRELAPDVICLQEVFHIDVLEAYRTAFPDYCIVAFGRAQNFAAMIALVAIIVVVAAVFAGSVWLVEKFTSSDMWRISWMMLVPIMIVCYSRLIRHHWTIAFLTGNRTGLVLLVRREAFELKEQSCVMYSRNGHAADFLNVLRPRGFIQVTCGLRLPGYPDPLKLRLVTTHLNQPLEQALGDGRHRQVKEVFQKCHQDDELCLLGCDLNATPPGTKGGSDCQTYEDVISEMSDAWAATNPSDPQRDGLTWDQIENPMCLGPINRLFYGKASRWRCDYIFSRYKQSKEKRNQPSFDVNIRSCEMVFTHQEAVSDHFGVYAVFDVRASDSEPVSCKT